MATFSNSENGFNFVDDDGYEIPLNQDNFFMWLSREQPLKDMAQVTDDRDDLSWSWFRYDVGEETFERLNHMAFQVGSFILRDTVTEDVQMVFDARHNFENVEDHLDELSDE